MSDIKVSLPYNDAMLGTPPPDAGNFAEVLRGAREAVERTERDARKKAAEIVQQAEQQAQKIVADAESEAKVRAGTIVQEAEERARQMPVQLLPTLITQVDDARIMLGEIRHAMQRLLDERGDTLPQPSAPEKPSSAPAPEQKGEARDANEDQPLHKPGAYTIVRGLRAQMVEEMMQGSNKGQPAAPSPPPPAAPAPTPEQEPSPAPPSDPASPSSQEDTRRRWPF